MFYSENRTAVLRGLRHVSTKSVLTLVPGALGGIFISSPVRYGDETQNCVQATLRNDPSVEEPPANQQKKLKWTQTCCVRTAAVWVPDRETPDLIKAWHVYPGSKP